MRVTRLLLIPRERWITRVSLEGPIKAECFLSRSFSSSKVTAAVISSLVAVIYSQRYGKL